jgi:uncharacterized protein YkwD
MSAKRSTTVYGSVAAAVAVTLMVTQCANGSMPAAFQPTDVTVVDARRQLSTTEPAVTDPQSPPSTSPAPTTPASTTPASTTTTTGAPVTTTTVLIDAMAAGPAEAGLAAPVRGEQFQLTEPIPAPATTTTTTEPPPPPTTAAPPPPQQQPAPPSTQPNPTQPPATQPPATQPPATQPPSPPPASTSNDAIALTNQERANAGLAPLNANGALNAAAAVHSADQAVRNLMTHAGSNGSNAGDRIRAAGYSPGTWGENVAAGYSSASGVVAGWMGSSGHRANILNPAFTQIGVASATSANGTRYWTMVLAG